MVRQTTKIPIANIILDEEIYPRERIDQKRVGIFTENIREGFQFDPIEVEPHSEKKGKYRILDGAHRLSAYKAAGIKDVEGIIIKDLAGIDPLLYAATRAIGPRQLNEEETKNTARKAFQNNPRLTLLRLERPLDAQDEQ